MRNKKTAYLTQAAMIAAIYVALTYIFAPISFNAFSISVMSILL